MVLQEQATESMQDFGLQGPILGVQKTRGFAGVAERDVCLWSCKTFLLLLLLGLPPWGFRLWALVARGCSLGAGRSEHQLTVSWGLFRGIRQHQ